MLNSAPPLPSRARVLLARTSARTHARVSRWQPATMAFAAAPPPLATSFAAMTPNAHANSSPTTIDDPLAPVVEHLERELSRRESSERALTRTLEHVKHELAERDVQMEDLCVSWERSISQMQQSRDEDVFRLTERLECLERVELPQAQRLSEVSETNLLRCKAQMESTKVELENATREIEQIGNDCERRVSIANRETQAAVANAALRLKETERRHASDISRLEETFASKLRNLEYQFESETNEMRRTVGQAIKGAAAATRMIEHNVASSSASGELKNLDAAAVYGTDAADRGTDGGGEHTGRQENKRTTVGVDTDISTSGDYVPRTAARGEGKSPTFHGNSNSNSNSNSTENETENSPRFAFWRTKKEDPKPLASPPPVPIRDCLPIRGDLGEDTSLVRGVARVSSALVPPPPARP